MSFKDHFSGHAQVYAQHRPDYPPELYQWLAAQVDTHEQVWDCGTGNGQAALQLAEHFQGVYATDASAAQIAKAPGHPTIKFVAEPAEQCGLPDASVDLLCVAQALHWFDWPRFYAEARRVLKPGGVIAAWTYTLLQVQEPLGTAIRAFNDEVVGRYWPPERTHVDDGYQRLPFPFAEIEPPELWITRHWRIADVIAYLRTWSAMQRYVEASGQDPLPKLEQQLQQALPAAVEQAQIVKWPLKMRVGRHIV